MKKTVFAPEIIEVISGLRRDPLFYFLLLACSALTFFVYGATPTAMAVLSFVVLGSALAVIDQRHFLLPDVLVFALLLSGLTFSEMAFGLPIQASLAGMGVGFAFFWVVRWAGSVILKREAMGLGDVKLLAAIGAWVGLINLPALLLMACLLALPFSLLQRWRTPEMPETPFGPALLAAGLITLIFPLTGWKLLIGIRQSVHQLLGLFS